MKMTIYFDKKIYGLRLGEYNNKRINVLHEMKFKKMNKNYLDIFMNKIENHHIIHIYILYSTTNNFIDNKYNYMWIKVDKDYLEYIKYNISLYI